MSKISIRGFPDSIAIKEFTSQNKAKKREY
jgi:hypothetical protein